MSQMRIQIRDQLSTYQSGIHRRVMDAPREVLVNEFTNLIHLPAGWKLYVNESSIVLRPMAQNLPLIKLMWNPMGVHHEFGTRRIPKSESFKPTSLQEMINHVKGLLNQYGLH